MVQYVNRYVDQLSKHFDDIPRLKGLADSFNVGTGHIALGLIALTCFCVLIGQGVNFFVNLLGVVYPAYLSFKALESEGHADDKQWLCYWVVFGAFTTTDTLTDSLLCWVPFYQPTKLLMLLFLAWPETRGAQLVYDRFLQPFLKKHEIKIDEALSNVGEKVQEAKSEAMHKDDRIKALEEELAQGQGASDTGLAAKLDELRGKVKRLEGVVEERDAELATLQASYPKLDRQRALVENELKKVNASLSEAQKKVSEQKIRILKMSTVSSVSDASLESLKEENRELSLKIVDLKDQLSGSFDAEVPEKLLEEKDSRLDALEEELESHASTTAYSRPSKPKLKKRRELTQEAKQLKYKNRTLERYQRDSLKYEKEAKALKAKLSQEGGNTQGLDELIKQLSDEVVEKNRKVEELLEEIRLRGLKDEEQLNQRRVKVFRSLYNNWTKLRRFNSAMGLMKWKALRRAKFSIEDEVVRTPQPQVFSSISTEAPEEFKASEASMQVERETALANNEVIKLFERFGSKSERPMSNLNIFKFFEELMDSKAETDVADIKARRQPRTMTEFMMEHLKKKYGMPVKNLSALLLGIRQLMGENHQYAILFARFLQVFHPDPIPFSLAMFLTKARIEFHELAEKLAKSKPLSTETAPIYSTFGRESYKPAGTGGEAFLREIFAYVYRLLENDFEGGVLAVKVLKPDLINLVDYVVYLVCYKLRTAGQTPSDLFTLLDERRSDSLNQQEFIEGLQSKYSVWVSTEDLTVVFNALRKPAEELSRAAFEKGFSMELYKTNSVKAEYYTTKCKFLSALALAYSAQQHRDNAAIRSQFSIISEGQEFLTKDLYLAWVRQNATDLSEGEVERYWGEMLSLSSDLSRGVSLDAFCRIVMRYGIGNYGKGKFTVRGLEGATEERKLERTDVEYTEGGASVKIERRSTTTTRTERTELIEEGEGSEEEEETRKVTTARRRTRRARRG
jgi:receptor expression-enhancing protein 5/6